MIRKGAATKGVIGVADLSKVIKRWPAIMFAARRTAKVPGRIKLLVVSIRTIKGMSTGGVP